MMDPFRMRMASEIQGVPPSRYAPSTRGFTLTELMVALTGGLFVSMVVFALARDGSRFYHREARVAEATLGTVIGFDRLRHDITRAGFLSTPNVAADNAYCGNLGQLVNFPKLQQLASIQITADSAAALNSVLKAATPPITPNQILLSGAYSSLDRFDAIGVFLGAGNQYAVRLQSLRGALFRMNFPNLSATAQTDLLAQLFPPRRALRLVSTDSGTFQFGVIASTGLDANGTPTIYLAADPPLILSGATASRCNASTNQQVNVVNLIRYSLTKVYANAADFPSYQQLFDTSGNLAGEATRLELVREELYADGAVDSPSILETREVIAEYAVDLRFAVTYVVNPNTAAPSLLTAPFDSANLFAFAGPVAATNPTAQPQNIRSVRARLSLRSREADRGANVTQAAADIAPGLYRIAIGESGAGPFARVRTLQADTFIVGNSQ